MDLMEEKIRRFGEVGPADILKVDGFLNHQIDIGFMDAVGAEMYRLYADSGVNKILTIESSGIAVAVMAARHFDVPVVFAKKMASLNLDGAAFESRVYSYTKQREYHIRVSRKFLGPQDKVLIVDDFLAKGKAISGLLDIIRQSGAEVVGMAIAIEKGFQGGGDQLRAEGYRVESLAIIDAMEDGKISFRRSR